MPLTAPTRLSPAAAALIRAGLLDEAENGLLIISQNGGQAAGPEGAELTGLTIAVTGLAVRVLLSANGGNVQKAMAVIDQWMTELARQPAA